MSRIIRGIKRLAVTGGGAATIDGSGLIHGIVRAVHTAGTDQLVLQTKSSASSAVSNSMSFSSGGMSISGNTIHNHGMEVRFVSDGLSINAPNNKSLTINGKKFSIAALMSNQVTPITEPPPETNVVLQDCKIDEINIEDDSHLTIGSAAVMANNLSVATCAKAVLKLPSAHRFKNISINASGSSHIDGGACDVDVFLAYASGMSHSQNFIVLQSGRVNASGMSTVVVSAYARECIEKKVEGGARVTVNLVSGSHKPRALTADDVTQTVRVKKEKREEENGGARIKKRKVIKE